MAAAPVTPREKSDGSPQNCQAGGPATPAEAEAAAEAATTKGKKPTWKDMLKKHGPVFLVYWNGMWLLSGLTIYAGLTLGGIDPMPLAYAVNLDRFVDLSRLDPAHGNVAVAIVLNEAAELVRFPFVIATVPRVTRWWEGVRPEWMKPKLGPGTCRDVMWTGGVFGLVGAGGVPWSTAVNPPCNSLPPDGQTGSPSRRWRIRCGGTAPSSWCGGARSGSSAPRGSLRCVVGGLKGDGLVWVDGGKGVGGITPRV